MRTLPSQSSFPSIPHHPSITFTLDRVVHAEAVLIFLYLISAPVLIAVFTAFRGPVDVLLFFVNYPPAALQACPLPFSPR
jgi:hypothetical protein